MTTTSIIHATDATFAEQVIVHSKTTPVLVDFWAEWCGPCKAVAPVLEQLAANNEGKLRIVKIDVDAHSDSARKYNVSGIPTLVLFSDGEEKNRAVGAMPLEQYQQLVQPYLA